MLERMRRASLEKAGNFDADNAVAAFERVLENSRSRRTSIPIAAEVNALTEISVPALNSRY